MQVLLIGGCGYIGSALYNHLRHNFSVTTVDLEWFGNCINPENLKQDYDALPLEFLEKFSAIILLAGHSAVAMGYCFHNNVVKFVHLLRNINKQKFIYASSASVYAAGGVCTETSFLPPPTFFYDLSKQEIDLHAGLSGVQYYALRFGTVNGYSPNLRSDLIINKMVESAKNSGKISVMNRDYHRPILGISDLCRAIETILMREEPPGVYNLASFNATIGEIAVEVATYLKVCVEDKGSCKTYDLQMSTEKFCNTYNFTFADTIESIVYSLETWPLLSSGRHE